MKEPKFYIKIQKAYQDGGDWYVQGIASGTAEDRDGERMGVTVLEKFARSIPLPLTDNHPVDGDVLAELGQVVDAQVLDDENNSLFIKAKLDADHPAVPYMVKQINKGKRYAFSVEGIKPSTQMVYSDKLKKMITEYVDVTPKAISITTEPSYMPSFMEVVSKSYKLSKNTDMKDEEVKTTETEKVTVEEVVADVLNSTEEVKAEDKAEEVANDSVKSEPVLISEEEPKDEAKADSATVSEVKVDKSKKALKSLKKAVDPAELAQAVNEAIQEVQDEAEEEEQEQEEKEMELKELELILGLCMKVDLLCEKVDQLMESDSQVHEIIDSTQKSFKSTEKVLKSFHEEMEILKNMPLQKRSRVLSKSYDDRQVEEDKPKTMRDIVSNLI